LTAKRVGGKKKERKKHTGNKLVLRICFFVWFFYVAVMM